MLFEHHLQREHVMLVVCRIPVRDYEHRNSTYGSLWDLFRAFVAGCVQDGCFAPVCNLAVSLGSWTRTQLVRDAVLKGVFLAPASARWVSSSILEEASGPPGTLAGWIRPFWVPFWMFW